MDGERISLRLESEDLYILDEFLESHPEYSNRSNLARVAIREFIENSNKPKSKARSADGTEILLQLPPAIYQTLYAEVEKGWYNTIEEVLMHYIRKSYSEALETVRQESMKAAVESSSMRITIDK